MNSEQANTGRARVAMNASARRQLRVLVVDDEPGICKLLEDVLALHGHSVVAHTSGRDGVAAARSHSFDLVLLDIHLPDLAGPEVLHELRRELPKTVFVMMTGYADDQSVERSLGDGAFLCLYKPLSVAQVLELTEDLFGSRTG